LSGGINDSPQYAAFVTLPNTYPTPRRAESEKAFAAYVGVRESADSLAFPGVIGALENVSYGAIGAAGEPAMNAGPSGGFVPLPCVLCEMNVVCASTAKRNVPGGCDAAGFGEADAPGAGAALAVGAGAGDATLCAAAGTAYATHEMATARMSQRTTV
jgi:hypothetical protein